MWFIFKRLFLGFFLIALAASVLLVSDWRSRKKTQSENASPAHKIFKIAVLQHSSQSVLGDGVKGMLDVLAEKGFVDGQNIKLERFNAEGDLPTASTIAKNITDGSFDLILTASTPSLQAVANANKTSNTKHVFALVSDPYGAGVGISRTNHLDHPPYLAGFGTMQPVIASFKLARQMRPELKSVGVVWNAAESNSEANLKEARKICQELGIELLEATVDNSSGVYEAANSLASRGAEALWVPGDNTVLVAIDSMIQAGRRGKIPVFTVIPPHSEKGALFDIGADYVQVGRLAGELAVEILNGRDPATVAIENVVPEMLVVNKLSVNGLKDKWEVPNEIAARADTLIDQTGIHRKEAAVARKIVHPPLSKKWRITQLAYAETPNVEEAQKGVVAGLKEAGLVEGRDYDMKFQNAQGDMSTMLSIVDASVTEGTDLLLVATTPALQASLKRGKGTPIVFTLVANPVIAGAGKSEQDHLPNVTGSYMVSPFNEMIDALKKSIPNVKRIGTLFVPSEVNSVYYKDTLLKVARKAGLEVETVGVSSSGDVADAAIALCGRHIDAICQISDNLTGSTFASIAQAAKRGKMPLFGFNSTQSEQGALLCVSRDYFDNGREAALMTARILRGADPAKMPFQQTGTLKYFVNLQAAEANNVKIPEALLKLADQIIGKDGKIIEKVAAATAPKPKSKSTPAPLSKKWNVAIIEYNQTIDVEETEKGIFVGLQKAGLIKGRDFDVKVSNAQNDMPTLSGLVDSAVSSGADLIITVSTPTLQAAIHRAGPVPIVFTYCANAVAAGAARTFEDHLPNLTGLEVPGAYDELIKTLRECLPNVKTIGTLYAPSEVNMVFHREKIIKAAAAFGIKVESVAAENSADVADAALALCNRNIDAVCQIPGNLTAAAFPSIARAAQGAKLPLFASLSAQAKAGAAVAVARDYYFVGIDTGIMAARVMRGENPATIPIQPFSKTKLIVNLDGAKACGLTIPPALLKRADVIIQNGQTKEISH